MVVVDFVDDVMLLGLTLKRMKLHHGELHRASVFGLAQLLVCCTNRCHFSELTDNGHFRAAGVNGLP